MNKVQDLFDYIGAAPTPWHAAAETVRRLEQAGWKHLYECDRWELEPGKKYFTTRADSAVIAWRMPKTASAGWRMSAAHSDSPAFKVKGTVDRAGCTMLDLEGYGGMIRPSWLDRPLGIAGRLMVEGDTGIETRLVDLGGDAAIIPHLAIHMDRTVNSGHNYDLKKDMQALYSAKPGESLMKAVEKAAGISEQERIAGMDLLIYCPQPGVKTPNDLVICPRLDDLACAWACLEGLLNAPDQEQGAVFCLFDNEEVGSGTRQGAVGSFLPDVLARANAALGADAEDVRCALANTLLLSADNGHAIHPNFAEMSDPSHPVRLGGGVVLKFNSSQKYTTTGETAAIFESVCDVPVQSYYNRADLPGGSTLGNLLSAQVSVPMADIGLPQLAMHSCVETAEAGDVCALAKACSNWYAARIKKTRTGWDIEE